MGILSASMRAKIPAAKFAGPGRSFPVNDKAHAKAAILDSGSAPASERAGIKAKAEKVLKEHKVLRNV